MLCEGDEEGLRDVRWDAAAAGPMNTVGSVGSNTATATRL
jgi:hypothetical protein